jgi:hypothetical protein
MNKYEKLIEYIINDDESKARELFHEIVVEKSRDIYESLMDAEVEETVGGNAVDSLVDEISADEEGISEDDLEGSEEFELGDEESSDEEMDAEMDFDASGELDSHEEEHGEVEDRVQDLEDALDELKAEFDKLMSAEAGEEEHAGEFEQPEVEESVTEAEECDDEEDEDEEDEEKVKESKSEVDLMREYVEKVSAPSNTEGADNKQSTVAGKNDMGGTTANIAKGGEETGRTAPKAKEIASGNRNVPGGKADTLEKVSTPKSGE